MTHLKPDTMIANHGDGNLEKIIPELIEIGVEILNLIKQGALKKEITERPAGKI